MKLSNSAKAFARDLLAQIERAGNYFYECTRKKRTEKMRNILRQMARKLEHKFQPHQLRHRKEFLCDFVWLRWHKSHPLWLERLALVAECEWSTSGKDKTRPVLYDFRKLLPLRADLKLLVYQTRPDAPDKTGQKYINKICDVLEHYKAHMKGETYFLLELNRSLKRPLLYCWRVSAHGKVARPFFHQLR
jgi:hypothetical protein